MNQKGDRRERATAIPYQKKQRVWIRIALSYALAIACLVWVFHDYDFSYLFRRVLRMNLLLVGMAITCDALSFVCQGLRWRLLLRPFGSISVLCATQAIYSGMFVNEVLPMKLGELLRVYLITRWTSVKPGAVATSTIVERLFDGFWLVSAFMLTMIFIPLPRRLIETGDALGALVLILIGLLIVLSRRGTSLLAFAGTQVRDGQNWLKKNPEGEEETKRDSVARSLARSLGPSLNRLGVELQMIVHSPSSLFAFVLSLLLVSLQWCAFWLVMLAFELRLSLLQGAAVFVIVHIGTSLPGAPGNIGTYQFFTVLGLTLGGVDKTSATGFSLVVFILLSTHICVLGFWAFRRSSLTLFGMRTELSESLRRLKTDA